jgi:hypothetical protein
MKKIIIIVGVILLVIAAGLIYFRMNTKSFSPEANVEFERGDLKIHVFYNRPYKKGREIFGALVPYGKVWRTGANEATVFETNKDLLIRGKVLKAGAYTLWTVPGEQNWSIIFNSETGQWGIDFNGEANREPSRDVLQAEAPALTQDKEFEQFTISVERVGEEMELIFLWNHTLVSLPMQVNAP